MKERLELFAKWMQEKTTTFDERDGVLETALRYERERTIQEIGSLLEEILTLEMENVIKELK